MTRVTPASPVIDYHLNDDEFYTGVLASAKFEKSKKPEYPDQIVVEWELRGGVKLRDYIGISLGLQAATKQPSKLRQLLNALGEQPKDGEVWFDPESLEWGHDMEPGSPAYGKLAAGMAVQFKGEKRKGNDGQERYKVTGYRSDRGR